MQQRSFWRYGAAAVAGSGLGFVFMMAGATACAGIFRGQLIAGPTVQPGDYPTTRGIVANMEFYHVAQIAFGSSLWWAGVVILSVLFLYLILKIRGIR